MTMFALVNIFWLSIVPRNPSTHKLQKQTGTMILAFTLLSESKIQNMKHSFVR